MAERIYPSDRKNCRKCSTTKINEDFYRDQSKRGGLSSYCKDCARANGNSKYTAETRRTVIDRSARWRLANPEKWAYTQLRSVLKKYDLTPEEYDSMVSIRNGGCDICKMPCATGKRLAVDHCHKTGRVRGLLCASHNTALGRFKDEPGMLSTAISYLAKSGQLLTTEELADLLLHQSPHQET